MSARLRKMLAPLLAVVILAPLVGCSSGNTVRSEARLEELGNQFSQELDQDYLYYRQSLPALLEREAVIVADSTYNIQLLYDFYETYQTGGDASLVTVFQSSSFVVTKIVFEDGVGHYFRYEFNPLRETEIVVASEFVESVELVSEPELRKATLQISRAKKAPIEVSYKNIAEQTQ